MKHSILAGLVVVLAAGLYPATGHAQHVNNVPGTIPPPYNGDIEQFCRKGYRTHGWIQLVPEMGLWMPIRQYPNFQYIPSYVQRCRSGGMISSGQAS